MCLLQHTSRSSSIFEGFEDKIPIISGISLTILFLVILINGILYSKVGELSLDADTITIQRNGWVKTIPFHAVKNITLKHVRGKEYILKLDRINLSIELSNQEFAELKKLKTSTPIHFPKPTFFNKISRWFTIHDDGFSEENKPKR